MDTYEFLFEWQCFCPPDYIAPVLVMVNQGAITKVIDVKFGQSISVNKYKNYSTIDKLFEFIQSAIDEEVVQIDVNYHPKYGFPTKAWLDWNRLLADEEKDFFITEFKNQENIIWKQGKK